MKYLVKNLKTEEETLCEKVVVGGFDYYLGDDETGDETLYISWKKDYATESKERYVLYMKSTGLNGENPKKVIATTNLSLNIPMVIDEVEELASRKFGNGSHHVYNRSSYCRGYKKAKETYQFTKEDMVEFTEYLNIQYRYLEHTKALEGFGGVSELIDIWQSQRTITIIVK